MATGRIETYSNYIGVELRKSATLTINQNNTISFATEISNNTPSGWEFHHIELLGVWPLSTWTGGVVTTRAAFSNASYSTSIDLVTTVTQSYSINIRAWYTQNRW